MLNHFVLADLILTEGYEYGTLRKELIITPLMERFKTVTLRNSY